MALRRRIALAGAAAALVGGMTHAPRAARAQQAAGLAALNAVRQAAGLNPLQLNETLNRAAADHAAYLARNNLSEHLQLPGRPGFTGRTPTDRAHHAGYPAAGVSENLDKGAATAPEAVDDLMTAIYHRFGFLALDIDEVGIGLPPGDPKVSPYVFNMSDSGLVALCQHPPEAARFQPPGTFAQLCGPEGPKLKIAAVEAAQQRLPAAAPAWVLWPPPGYDRTPPAFFDEEPDPLPDRKVSGYPISVQFNRAKVRRAVLRAFKLRAFANGATRDGATRESTARDVTPLRPIDARSDPNRRFTALDFAWFPLQRLEWDTAYQATADFEVDGKAQHLVWEFRTRALGMPVITLGAAAAYWVADGKDHAIYAPPADPRQRASGFAWEFGEKMQVDATAIDPNTLRLRVTGPPCSQALLKLPGGRQVTLKVLPPGLDAAGAETACAVSPPDFAIAGAGERLRLEAGRRYRIRLKSHGAAFGKMSWGLPATMTVKVEYDAADVLGIEVQGRPCDSATFQFSGGRTFQAAVAGAKCPATPTARRR